MTPWIAPSRFACPLTERAVVMFHPDDLPHRRSSPPGWWRVREQLLPELGAGHLVLLTTGPIENVSLEVTGEPRPLGATPPLKSHRLPYQARHGRVFIGPASALPGGGDPGAAITHGGVWVDLLPGFYAVEVELVDEEGGLRLRVVPAADSPAEPSEVPYIGPGRWCWDHFIVRSDATERLLMEAAAMHAPSQSAFADRIAGHDGFDLDQYTETLILCCGPRPIARASFHAIGTYGFASGTWRWAWSNPTIEMPLRRRVERVRVRGALCGERLCLEEDMPLMVADVERVAGLAAHWMGLVGWYAAAYDEGMLLVAVDGATLREEAAAPSSPS